MASAGRVLAALGAVVVAAVAAGVWLVMSEPGPVGEGGSAATEVAPGPEKPDKGPAAAKKPGRRHAQAVGDCAVFGTVRRRDGSAPAAGQQVVLTREDADPWTAAAGDDGTFRIAGLGEGGPYDLSVAAPGCATVRIPGIVLTKGEDRDLGTLWLDKAIPLTVSVRTWGGVPVEGADVEAFSAPDYSRGYDWQKAWAQMRATPVPVSHATTAADGTASFPEMASGVWTFTARKDGFAKDGRTNVRLEGGVTPPQVTIYLATGHALKGRVLDGDKRPLQGVLVLGGRPTNAWDVASAPLRARSTSDAEGRYELTGLPTGDISLMTAPPGAAPFQVATVRVPGVTVYDLFIRSGGSLTGTVTDSATGKGIEGATVRVSSWSGWARSVEATTDAEGKYAVAAVPDGPINDVSASKDGWMQDRRDEPQGNQIQLYPGDTAVRDVKMRQGARLTGVVRGPEGPLAGARIAVWVVTPDRGMQGAQKQVSTDAEGRYEIGPLEQGTGMVQAVKEGFIQKGMPENPWMALQQQGAMPPQYRVEIPAGGDVTMDVTLERGARIEGRVETDQGPLAGATVMLWGTFGQAATATSAADGKFALEGATPGAKARLYPSKEGFVSATNEPVQVLDGEPTTGVVLKMTKQKTVTGKVASASGAPLKDAQVTVILKQAAGDGGMQWDPAMQWGGNQQNWSPVQEDGSYEATIPWASGSVAVQAQAIDHALGESPTIQLQDSQDEYRADVLLEAGYEVRGRVIAQGVGVGGADVTIAASSGRGPAQVPFNWNPGMNQGGVVVAVSAADGAFTIGHVATGTYAVAANAEGYVRKSVNDVQVPPGSVTVEIEPGLEISGKVVFGDGSPAPGAVVSAQKDVPEGQGRGRVNRSRGNFGGFGGAQGIAGPDGGFRIRQLESGNYKLTANPPWNGSVNFRARTTEPVSAGTEGYSLQVEAGGVISGRVVDPHKKPVASVWVYVGPTKPEPGFTGRNAKTKADGSFEITGLGDGPYNLTSQPPQFGESSGYLQAQMENVAVGSTNLELAFEEGLTIEGVVADGQGKPLPDASLMLQPRQDANGKQPNMNWSRSQATSGADGSFRFQGLSPGSYAVTLIANQWQGSRYDGMFATGADPVVAGSLGVRIVVVAGEKVAGVVVDENGRGIAGAWVNANGQGVGKGAQTGKDGTFEITGLPRGQVNVSASAPDRVPAQVEKVDTGTLVLRIVLPKGATLTGRVLDGSGNPFANQGVMLRRTDGDKRSSWVRTNAEGTFTARNLPEGTYEVLVNRQKADGSGQWEQVKAGTATTGEAPGEFRVP